VVGPQDQGRRMSLDDFEFAEVKEGYHYELSRGVIVVSDVPDLVHFAQYGALRDQLARFKLDHPNRIYNFGGGAECKLLMPDTESERHPDLVIYRTPPPRADNPWRVWIPDIVIEIVSLSSEVRDYVEKREDYWHLGVKEYWIVDANRREMWVLRRQRRKWAEKRVKETETYSTRLLPCFVLELAPIFAAADAALG